MCVLLPTRHHSQLSVWFFLCVCVRVCVCVCVRVCVLLQLKPGVQVTLSLSLSLSPSLLLSHSPHPFSYAIYDLFLLHKTPEAMLFASSLVITLYYNSVCSIKLFSIVHLPLHDVCISINIYIYINMSKQLVGLFVCLVARGSARSIYSSLVKLSIDPNYSV